MGAYEELPGFVSLRLDYAEAPGIIVLLSERNLGVARRWSRVERDTGIEPASQAWEARVLPLY